MVWIGMTVRTNVYLIYTIFSIQQTSKQTIKYKKCNVFIDKPVI